VPAKAQAVFDHLSRKYARMWNLKNYNGEIKLEDLNKFEVCFNIRVSVYTSRLCSYFTVGDAVEGNAIRWWTCLPASQRVGHVHLGWLVGFV
jgi:hypothetical protein